MVRSMRLWRLCWLLLVLLTPMAANARYVGGEPPSQCLSCGCSVCSESKQSTASGSLPSQTEGNVVDTYDANTAVTRSSGRTLAFSATYNSKQADGSHSRSSTVMGYGWTHSYNTLLFSQRGHMFRLDADGRVTKYTLGPGGTFTAAPGYFETLVRNPDGSFTLRQSDGTVYEFAQVPGTPFLVEGPVWRLISITDRNDNVTSLDYTAGQLTQVTDTYGQSLGFSYSGNLLSQVTDPLGRVTQFAYNANALVQVTDPQNQVVQYSYNSLAQMVQKMDKDGRVFTYQYNAAQRPTGITDGSGNPILSLSNPNNWATNNTALTTNMLRQYTPSTTSKTDGRGNVWRYQYDQNGYITRLTAPDGAVTRYSYDPATLRMASQTDAKNRSTHYAYDAQGNLLTRTDPLGNVTSYTYEPVFNNITSETDANGRVTSYAYDSRGNRIEETDPLLGTREWTYDARGNVLTETDRNGNLTSYQYDAIGQRTQQTDALGNVTAMTYDAVGNLVTQTNARGYTTTYDYDGLNRLVTETDAHGNAAQTVYDAQDNRTQTIDRNGNATDYQYDERQRLTEITDALGHTTKYTYDGNDNRMSATDRSDHTTTYQYDVQNRPVQTNDALGNTTTMTYDAVGNRLTATDANGHTTTYQYDALNRLVRETDAEANVTIMAYDTVGGCPACTGPTRGSSLVTRQRDAQGKVTYFKYDGLDRLIIENRKQTDAVDVIDANDAVTRYSYDAEGNRLSVTEPNGNVSTYTYDALNRPTQETNAAGDATATTYDPVGNVATVTQANLNVTSYTYDALDRVTQVDDLAGSVATFTYDDEGNRLAQSDGNGNGTSTVYDTVYRITEVTDALGRATRYDYDPVGNLLAATDRESNVTTYTYDSINRRTEETDALGATTQYQYDGVGNLIRITDANAHATTYSYDNIDRRLSETYADGGSRIYTYDRVGNLKSRSDQKGQVTTYTYSDLYFLTRRNYPVTADDTMTYDLSGRLLTAQRGPWLVTYSYDGANRVTQTTQNGSAITYSYDIPGRTRTLTYPGGRTITELADARGRLDSIDDADSPPPIVQYSYDPGNRVLTRDYRNGTATTYSYNDNNWLIALDHSQGATRIAGFAYDYDDEGNARYEAKLTDAAASNSRSEAYQYDNRYRLVDYKVGPLVGSSVPVPSTQTQYSLDPLGNWDILTRDAIPEARSHSVTNEITQIGAAPVLSDLNGNTSEDSKYRYTYDEENRLIRVNRKTDNRAVGRYEYDALSRRIKKIANAGAVFNPVETRYYHDDARIIEEQDAGGVTRATYVYGNYVDEILAMERAGQAYYYHQNKLWSVAAITDDAGSVVERYAYDAYGLPTISDGSGVAIADNAWGTPHSAIGNSWMFTGRQFDEETGFYFYRARIYDPVKGRFLQRDYLAYVDGMNLYSYVGNNPVNRVDPNGLAAECNPKCGLDITKRLATGLNKVKTIFLSKSQNEREDICISSRRLLGWDISALIGDRPKNLLANGDCGTGTCESTVTINGECHYAAAVNYKFYGLLDKCHDIVD